MFTKHTKIPSKLTPYIIAFVAFTVSISVNIYAINSIVIDDSLPSLTNSPSTITNAEIREVQDHPATYCRFIKIALQQESLTGSELYDYYVDQITSTIYPDVQAKYVKAIVWHESRYNPDVVNSKTGVCGLMQISPKWHMNRARSLGVDDLSDPYGNLLVGCDILNELTQQRGFSYALNFFAGGYGYADLYRNSTSPFQRELEVIIKQMECGDIVIGDE